MLEQDWDTCSPKSQCCSRSHGWLGKATLNGPNMLKSQLAHGSKCLLAEGIAYECLFATRSARDKPY